MKYPENIKELWKLPIDYMGLIFYAKSPRYAETLDKSDLMVMPEYIERVGVFVNPMIDYVLEKTIQYKLNMVQLHGNESGGFCQKVSKSVPVIKAFSISNIADIEHANGYEDTCKFFLFDTKTPQYGGSGVKFDWKILDAYTGNTPFFLSGGISADDAEAILKIKHPMFYGIDLNSKFETEPGLKNIDLLKQFIKQVRDEQN